MRRFIAVILLGLLLVGFSGCGNNPSSDVGADPSKEEKLKVGIVEFSTAAGSRWVAQNVRGQQFAKEQLPWLELTTVESVPEDPSCVAMIKQLIDQGNKVIFANSFGYGQYMQEIAKDYPDVTFIQMQAPITGPNTGSYYGYLPEARYVEGIIAGMMTKNNKVGFVGGYPFPTVICGLNAFTLGARSVNPDVVVKVAWVNSFYDPAKEKEAANALLNAGVDIVANHTDSDAPLKAAAAKGALAFSSSGDWSQSAPEAFLTANTWNWGPYYVKILQDIKDGKFKPDYYWGSFADGVVEMAPYGSSVSPEAKAAADKAIAGFKDGSLKLFIGPIKDNAGTLRIEEGQQMSIPDATNTMDWLIEGVEGSTK